jgi:chromosome segregation ATPase
MLRSILVPRWALEILRGFELIQRNLLLLNENLEYVTMDLATLQSKADNILQRSESNTVALEAVKTYVEGQKQQLVDLKAQLDEALANGGKDGVNEAALQALSDTLDKLSGETDSQATAEAILANTPADPNANPAPNPPVGPVGSVP